MERLSSAATDERFSLQNFFKLGSDDTLPMLDSEAQLQDFLKKIPSSSNLAAGGGVPDPPTPVGMQDATAAAAAAAAPAGAPHGVPRVASLDFIRAFLNARQGGGDAANGPAGLPGLGSNADLNACTEGEGMQVEGSPEAAAAAAAPGGSGGSPRGPRQVAEEQLPEDGIIKPEPACSPGTGLTPLAPASLPIVQLQHSMAASEAAAAAGSGAAGGASGVPAGMAMPPAVLAAFMQHAGMGFGGGGSLGGLGMPGMPMLHFPMPMPLVPASCGTTDAGMVPSLPTSTAAGGSDCGPAGGSSDNAANHGTHNPDSSKLEQRRARRMLSNRESARRSRKRKQEHLGVLEGQLREVEGQLADATAKVARLSEDVMQRDGLITMMRQELDSLHSMLVDPVHPTRK